MSSTPHTGRWRPAMALVLTVLAMAWSRPGPAAPAEAPPQKAAAIADPQAVAIPDVAVVVRIGRIDQLLPKVEVLATPLVPGVNAESLKSTLGSAIGDPTLAGVDLTRSALLCLFDFAEGGFAPVAVVPVASETLKAAMQARGNLVYQKEGGKTLLTTDAGHEKAMVAARENLDKLEALLKEPMPSDVTVYVNFELMTTRHGAAIDGAIKEMMKNIEQAQQMMGQPSAMNPLLAMEVAGVVATVKEIKDLGLDVNLTKEGVDLGMVLRAKPGTSLAKVLDPQSPSSAEALGYLPRSGALSGWIGYDGARMGEFLAAKVDEAFATVPQTTATAALKRDVLKKWLEDSCKKSRGTAFDFLTPGGANLLNGVLIVEATDAKVYLDGMRNLTKDMEATGVTSFYKNVGMEMKMEYKDKVRDYKGTPIGLLTVDMNMPSMMAQMPPPMTAFMKSVMHQEYEIAVVGNMVVQDWGAKKMDTILDALKAKKPLSTTPLAAQGMGSQGAALYMDILPGRIVNWGVQLVQMMMPMGQQGPEFEQMMAKLKGLDTKPFSMYGAIGGSKLQAKVRILEEPILKIKEVLSPPPPPPPPPVAP